MAKTIPASKPPETTIKVRPMEMAVIFDLFLP